MNESELAERLRSMCRNAPNREKSTAIHLFGIRYVTDLAAFHGSIERVTRLSGVGNSYGTEICKGMKLAKYVELNDRAAAMLEAGSQGYQDPQELSQEVRPRGACVCGIPIAEARRLCTERDCFYK